MENKIRELEAEIKKLQEFVKGLVTFCAILDAKKTFLDAPDSSGRELPREYSLGYNVAAVLKEGGLNGNQNNK